jgi:hypothetical protein
MPATTPWFQGSVVPLAWTSTDTSGNPFEGTSVALTVTLPDRTTTSPAVTHNGSGSYSASLTSTQAGHHVVLWTATAIGLADAFADSFEVQSSADPTIVSLAQAKSILKLTGTTELDADLQSFNASATEVAEWACGAVVTRMYTEVIRASGRALILSHSPVRTDLGTALDPSNRRDGSTTNGLVSITPLLSYGFMYDIDQLLVDPDTGIVRHSSGFPFFYTSDYLAQYKAVYWAGRAVIPAAIYLGARIILEHLYQVTRGGAGAQDVAAGESVTTVPGFGFAIPNRALELFATVSGSTAAFA